MWWVFEFLRGEGNIEFVKSARSCLRHIKDVAFVDAAAAVFRAAPGHHHHHGAVRLGGGGAEGLDEIAAKGDGEAGLGNSICRLQVHREDSAVHAVA